MLTESIEILIDDCDKVLDGEAKSIEVVLLKIVEGKDQIDRIRVTDERKIKNIRAMAYVLRNALYDAEQK
jgi:hypothetical protein